MPVMPCAVRIWARVSAAVPGVARPVPGGAGRGNGARRALAGSPEAVLHRQAGSREVMCGQLAYLVEASRRVNVTVQVIPFAVGPHIGLQGGFTLAEAPDRAVIVFVDNIADGQVSETEDTLAQVTQRFDALRAEALPKKASRDLIMKVAEEQWT
jgi:hypothetical protein